MRYYIRAIVYKNVNLMQFITYSYIIMEDNLMKYMKDDFSYLEM